MTLGLRVVGLLFGLGGIATAGAAECSRNVDREQFAQALRQELLCASRRIDSPALHCPSVDIPSCAEPVFNKVIARLVVSHEPAVTAGASSACLRQVYRAAIKFVDTRLRERIAGRRRMESSRHAFDRLDKCPQPEPRADEPSPRSTTRCPKVFDLAQPGRLVRKCLRPFLERSIGEVTGLGPVAPNVVLVLTDDQHPDALSNMPRTLDRVAAAGVHFTNAFTTTPLCSPSRAGILTGQAPAKHGVVTNGIVVDGRLVPGLEGVPTLATWFRSAGYRTAMIGKYLNGYAAISPQIPGGWDEWKVFVKDVLNYFDYQINDNGTVRNYGDNTDDYSTDVLARFTKEFIERSSDTPFFVVFAPFAPHTPSTPAPRHLELVEAMPPWRPPSWGESDLSDKPGWLIALGAKQERLLRNDRTIALGRASMAAVDEAVEAILDSLEDTGLSDNTIVVVTADHGIMWGEHRLIAKMVAYEESLRVPMIWRYPLRIEPGQVREELALNLDIAPTLEALTGVAMSDDFDGESLTGVLDETTQWRTDFVAENLYVKIAVPWQAVRTERYKYVRYKTGAQELYDLREDPAEMVNLARVRSAAEIVRRLSARLEQTGERPRREKRKGHSTPAGDEPSSP